MILVELDTNLGFFSVGNSQPTVKTKQNKKKFQFSKKE